MVCQSCGYSAAEGAFCSRCGAPVQAAPPNAAPNPNQNPVPMYGVPPGVPGMPPPIGYHPAYQPRVERHVQTLGILWCVYGGYRALGGIVAAAILMGLSIPGFFGDWGGMVSADWAEAADWARAMNAARKMRMAARRCMT